MDETSASLPIIQELPIPLERDLFLRTLVRELSGALQDVDGLEEASGFINVVGQRIGEQLNTEYKAALGVSGLNRRQVGEVLVDLKRRIQGDFFILEEDPDKIVLGNREIKLGRVSSSRLTRNRELSTVNPEYPPHPTKANRS